MGAHKKAIHDSAWTNSCAQALFFLPLGVVAAACAFWAVRLNYFVSYLVVPVAFGMSSLIYWLGLFSVEVASGWNSDAQKDERYEEVESRLLYNWFNFNPIHVLKSNYMEKDLTPGSCYKVPFLFGKEYLVAAAIPNATEQAMATREHDKDMLAARRLAARDACTRCKDWM